MLKNWKDNAITFLLAVVMISIIAHIVVLDNFFPFFTYLLILLILIIWCLKLWEERREQQNIIMLLKQIDADNLHDIEKPVALKDIIHYTTQAIEHTDTVLQLYEQRYRVIAQLINEVIFEYNIRENTICDSLNWNRIADGNHFIDATIEQKIVHPDDVNKFYNFFLGEQHINRIDEIEIRLRFGDNDEYLWTQIKGITLAGKDGKPEKRIGKRSIIDKIKRENETLQTRLQLDELCGIYNKVTTVALCEAMLRTHEQLAFCIFDIDDFKQVNDTYGHLAGDYVLWKNSMTIKEIFRKDDILGRVGGDEFLVVFPYQELSNVVHKAEQILHAMTALHCDEYPQLTISGSIGIALSPKDGTTFTTLYDNADKALYAAKRNGKRGYSIYRNDVEE